MNTQEIQLQFWTALQNSNPQLFAGTPHGNQYFDLVDRKLLPLKIRLDIYCLERDYTEKGYLTICIMLADNKARSLHEAFPTLEGFASEDADNRLYILRNRDSACHVGESVNEQAIRWFTENVQKIKDILH